MICIILEQNDFTKDFGRGGRFSRASIRLGAFKSS